MAKDIIIRTKEQATEWKKIFTNYISTRGLISKIRFLKNFKKLDTTKTNDPIEKWVLYMFPI